MRPGWLVLAVALAVQARGFDPARDVVLRVAGGVLSIELPPGVHLKCRTFQVAGEPASARITAGPMPKPDGRDDAGDPVWHGRLAVPLRVEGAARPEALRITFQPCTEGADPVCYLPQHRRLPVKGEDLVVP